MCKLSGIRLSESDILFIKTPNLSFFLYNLIYANMHKLSLSNLKTMHLLSTEFLIGSGPVATHVVYSYGTLFLSVTLHPFSGFFGPTAD